METLQDLLFDTPLWLFAVLAVVAVGLLVSGNRRQDRTLIALGLAVIGLGVVLGLLSYFVETDKEKCSRLTREAVQAVVDRNANAFKALLHPKVDVVGTSWDRDRLVGEAKSVAEQVDLKDVKFNSLKAQRDPMGYLVTLSVVSHQSAGKAGTEALPSTWRFTWVKGSNGWVVKTIEPVTIGMRPGSELIQLMQFQVPGFSP